ncbi:MAG TPA: DegT/DnrJ/EryC1/StrS family aminotransferase, partial [bacterium]|nr:DegT/DnrJ/EryC1/StrS family aminotransferase [bacterium]
HLYVIRTPQREALREKLIGKQIGVAIHYPIGIHEQVAFRNYSKQQFSLPVTESVCKEVLSLPMYPELSAEQIEYVAACVTNP